MASSPVATPSPDASSPPAPPKAVAATPPPDSPSPPAPPTAVAAAPPPASPLPPAPPLRSPPAPPLRSPPPPPLRSPPPPHSPPPPASPPPHSPPPAPAATPTDPTPETPDPSSTPSPPVPTTPLPSSNPPPSPQLASSSNPPPPSGGASSSPSESTTPSGALSPPSGDTPSNSSPSQRTPSPTKDSNNRNAHSQNDGADSNLPLVLGVSLGVGILFVLMIVALLLCAKKKKKQPAGHAMQSYDRPGPKGGYYNGGQLPKWQNGPQGRDARGNLPPPPGAAFSPQGQWVQPPTGAPAMNSSDASSGYSGPHGPSLPSPSPNVALGFSKNSFTYEELAAATEGFCGDNLLGQGGFGYVHRGVLPNGMKVAVKQLKSGSGQGEREFQAEVEIISRVHHRHLVSLVGYCIAGSRRMLVYEFVPNNTLEYHLHGKGHPTMDWSTRLKIAIGSAKGLAYLHEDCHPRIIHRDIKTANILLDNNFEAMVADFGLAKFTSDTNTHVSTRIMGTFGYLAPEYASTGKVTEKSDVFSFGVMLLELITGRRPVDPSDTYMEESLVDWARPILYQILVEENFDEVADPNLEKNYDRIEMARMIASAAACIRHSARKRPRMSQIVRALEGDVSLEDLNEGVKPRQNSMFSSGSDYDSTTYSSRMKQFRKVAFESNEDSNDYSAGTSDYGLNPSASTTSSAEISSAGSRTKASQNI